MLEDPWDGGSTGLCVLRGWGDTNKRLIEMAFRHGGRFMEIFRRDWGRIYDSA